MRYAYQDLGEQLPGTTAVVRWRGSPADVMLLDRVNFCKYRDGGLFSYHAGGQYRKSPAEIPIPEEGHWFVVIDLHGHTERLTATVEVIAPAEEGSSREELVAVG